MDRFLEQTSINQGSGEVLINRVRIKKEKGVKFIKHFNSFEMEWAFRQLPSSTFVFMCAIAMHFLDYEQNTIRMDATRKKFVCELLGNISDTMYFNHFKILEEKKLIVRKAKSVYHVNEKLITYGTAVTREKHETRKHRGSAFAGKANTDKQPAPVDTLLPGQPEAANESSRE